eukprot:52720-Lingulodinium_polyedra.AAC.1
MACISGSSRRPDPAQYRATPSCRQSRERRRLGRQGDRAPRQPSAQPKPLRHGSAPQSVWRR